MDMLQGSLADKIILFALPLAATGILQQLFNAADIAVVGNFASSDPAVNKAAMAAVGSNAPLIGLFVNLFVGIALGSNVAIAQAIGQRNAQKVTQTVHTSVLVALIGGAAFLVLGQLFTIPILHMMSVPDDVLHLSELYLRIYICGFPVIFLYNFESSIFRSVGDTRTPLVVLTISGVLNVLLNLLFVIGFHMSVAGVALATVISNAASAAVLFVLLLRTNQPVRLHVKKLRIHAGPLRHILKIGVPAGVQGMIFSLSNIIIQSAINSLGTTIMAASSAAFNIEIVAYYLINAFGQACTTFTGQNYGAGEMERCKKVLKRCVGLAFLFAGVLCTVILLFGKGLLHLFTADPEVIEAGYLRLVYIFGSYVFSLLVEVMSGYLRGFGYSIFPALATVIGVCGVRITWIYTVFPLRPTFASIMIIYPISMCVTAVILWAIYGSKRKAIYGGMRPA